MIAMKALIFIVSLSYIGEANSEQNENHTSDIYFTSANNNPITKDNEINAFDQLVRPCTLQECGDRCLAEGADRWGLPGNGDCMCIITGSNSVTGWPERWTISCSE